MATKKENPGKRGAKPYWSGSRQKLLEEHLDEYISLKHKNRNQFWSEFFAKWWGKFPWKLSDKEEPPLDDSAKMSQLASVRAGERENKSKVEAAVVARIKQWFAYQSQNRHSSRNDNIGLFHLVQRLHEAANPKPRKRSVVQQFMLEEPSLIDTEFAIKYGGGRGIDGADRMNKRHDIAKKLLENRYKDRVLDLEVHARESHEKETQQWSLALSSIELATDVDMARDSLFSATHALLKAIGLYTGCYVTLIAAAIPSSPAGNKDYFSTVHYVPDGKASRENWTEWDTDGFRIGVARQFKKYIKSMENVADSDGSPLGDPPAHTKTPTASQDAVPSSITVSARVPPQLSVTPTPSVTAAPKRTAAGKYKQRPIVYTEDGDSDSCSDHQSSDSETNSRKRPRMDAVITRARSKLAEAEVSNPLHDSPPALLRSPVPLAGHVTGRLDDVVANPPDPESPGQSTPDVDRGSSPPAIDAPPLETSGGTPTVARTRSTPLPEDRDSPSPTVPSDKASAVPSDKTPAVPSDKTPTRSTTFTNSMGITVAPAVGDVLLDTDPDDTRTTVIPQFLAVAQKKNKVSIHSYLLNCQDVHFRKLLQAYIAFENAAATSGRTGSLSTTGRPSHISWWIRCARVDTPPSWTNLRNYGSSVITWWSSLQPSWRELECDNPSREEGSLDCLFQPGINGLLNVVILAYWWSNGLTKSGTDSETESSRYRWFVADVTWVLLELFKTHG